MMWNIIQPLKNKEIRPQHRWPLKALCEMKCQTEKDKYCKTSLTLEISKNR